MPPRKFPVTLTRMATVRCQVCARPVHYPPADPVAEALTAHYFQDHPELVEPSTSH